MSLNSIEVSTENNKNKNLVKVGEPKINYISDIGQFFKTAQIKKKMEFLEVAKLKQEELLKYTFRPEGPKGKFEWLNTTQLNDVMDQYQKKYPEFSFLGAVPMDFNNLPELGIKTLDLESEYKNGKRKFGIIFNLDEHWQSGSHWVSAYFDLDKGLNLYSDSYGILPTPEVRSLMRRFAKFSEEKLNIKAEAKYNKKQHQQGGSECGMYSLNFIIELLKGKDFDKLTSERIPDSHVNNLRQIFFRNVDFKKDKDN